MKGTFVFFFLFLSFLPAFSQQESGRIVTKYNMRRHLDGQYIGLAYGELRIGLDFFPASGVGEAFQYYLEELNRDGAKEARQVFERRSSSYRLGPENRLLVDPQDDVIVFRNFPMPPAQPITEGMVWRSQGHYLVDPLQKGVMTRIPILVEYKALGLKDYQGRQVWEVSSLFALRYRGQDPFGLREIVTVQGSHSSIIYLDPETYDPVFFRTNAQEQYVFSGNRRLEQRGFILTWYEDVPSFAPQQSKEEVEKKVREETIENVEVQEVEEGLQLRLNNLLFVADQAILLPGEEQRLDQIAALLKEFSQRQFLVVGHTADVGTKESQKALSLERALLIVRELEKRGVASENLLYQGVGGEVPLAENSTEEGRRANRRVEITILRY